MSSLSCKEERESTLEKNLKTKWRPRKNCNLKKKGSQPLRKISKQSGILGRIATSERKGVNPWKKSQNKAASSEE
ncbi:hypothetical protein FH972_012548 [Carpinus fangiana]|uniref:Uncharacterized protein n=1 Tax=Carpinus fangiana TaxID=176857 RepID=A0A5N6R4C4_9ROSI|nr:hypothetical protein FH972_012548 [Carpinus fangiana]